MSERRSNSNKVIVQLDPDNSFSQDSPPDSMVIYQIVFSSQKFLKTLFFYFKCKHSKFFVEFLNIQDNL